MKVEKVVLKKVGVETVLDIRINDIFNDPQGWLAEWIMLNKYTGKVELYFDDRMVASSSGGGKTFLVS
jgi:hypothetical protein